MDESQASDNSTAVDNAQATATPEEKLFTRDQLAKIVNAESTKAAQAARQEAEAKYQADMESLRQQQQQTNAQIPRDVSADSIAQQVREQLNKEMQEQQQRAQMQQVAQNYLQKVAQGKAAYSDFDEVTKDFDPTAFPQLTFLLSGIDNAGDVLYDLAQNPVKLAGLDRLAERNPKQAESALLKLATSIKENRQAQNDAQNQNVAEPLDRLQPSRVSGSNGKMTIRDLRNQPWLRG